jgi:hypothetical protein
MTAEQQSESAADNVVECRRCIRRNGEAEMGGVERDGGVHIVDNSAAEVDCLRVAGVTSRNEIVTGPGGSQILLEDPSGHPIELFQTAQR